MGEINNIREWSIYVRERAGNRCEYCGKLPTGGYWDRIEAHHIYPQSKWPEMALDKNNGVALCRKCHDSFHIYLDMKPEKRAECEWCSNIDMFMETNILERIESLRMEKESD